MRANRPQGNEQFVLLTQWCCVTSAWRDTAERHDSVGAAESAATQRGIYRAVVVCGEHRLPMEPFAVVGTHPADDLPRVTAHAH